MLVNGSSSADDVLAFFSPNLCTKLGSDGSLGRDADPDEVRPNHPETVPYNRRSPELMGPSSLGRKTRKTGMQAQMMPKPRCRPVHIERWAKDVMPRFPPLGL
jgi:hypothetical protein